MKGCMAGFGEVMLRLSPAGKGRLMQSLPGTIQSTFGGAEANVCASIAMLGGNSRFLTALPDNAIARACCMELRSLGCDVSRIHFAKEGRMGVYYTECGSNMRGSTVIYDRKGSVISCLAAADYDFSGMLDGVTHLHLSGITPALSRNAFEATLAFAQKAAEMGLTLSVDLNFRKKLWDWEEGTEKRELARRCMTPIVELADIIIGNEEDASDVFGIASEGSSVNDGKLNIKGYVDVAEKLSSAFPKAKYVAITLRESCTADHNRWGGMLYDCAAKSAHFAPLDADGEYCPYDICCIVDRFGGGDSFTAGLLFALNTEELSAPSTAIRFAAAASALKHTVQGDYNYIGRGEVEALMNGSASGRVQR